MTALRVLVVEDEALIAMFIEDIVEQSGHVVAARASNIGEALRLAGTADFDVALLDLNLGGQRAHAVPVVLAARGKPFAFVTGYGEAGVLTSFDAPLVGKPFEPAHIEAVLRLLGERVLRDG
jgi:CheY-like chemotaxis protein